MAWSREKFVRKLENGMTDFSGKDLEGIDLSGLALSVVKFVGCNMRGADLSGAMVELGGFEQSDLSGANLSGGRFRDCRFRDANLEGVSWEGTEFSNCWHLCGHPLEVIGDSFSCCEFPERLQYVLEFQGKWDGVLDSEERREVVPIWVTLEREGREARVGVPCGGMPCRIDVPMAANAAGPFQIWWIENYLPPEEAPMPAYMRDSIKERGRELAEKVWIRALPEELDVLQARIDGLGETRDSLFETLADPLVNEIEVTDDMVRFQLGPFWNRGIRAAMERVLALGVKIASQLDADVP